MTTAMSSTHGGLSITCSARGTAELTGRIPVMLRVIRMSWRAVTIDVVVMMVIAVILGGIVDSALAGPLSGAVFALAAAMVFRSVRQSINTRE
ncbi:hypothetical protein [Rhodococcus erythropolis]|uniref:hypothetical protein n=1 Tax=Rhodococcus erythropolis TaxID=1833 RepID=UPI0011876C83|nr:hypothetical protein [Rhodococcus erythropolis]